MNIVSKKLSLVAASLVLVLAGCSKKPTRPSPNQTVLGPNGGGAGAVSPETLNPAGDNPAGLTDRNGDFDMNGQLRGKLESVYFDFNQSNIKPAERTKLAAAKDYLEKNPGQRLVLEGHCDWRGTAEYNLALGDRRANAAKKYLITIGAAADRLETISKGSLEAVKGDDAAAAKDRRVELVIVKAK